MEESGWDLDSESVDDVLLLPEAQWTFLHGFSPSGLGDVQEAGLEDSMEGLAWARSWEKPPVQSRAMEAAVHLSADNSLGVLNRNSSLSLLYLDDSNDYNDTEDHEYDQCYNAHASFLKLYPDFLNSRRQSRYISNMSIPAILI